MKPQGKMAVYTGNVEEMKAIEYLETLGYLQVTDEKAKKNARAWVNSDRDIADWCRKNADGDAIYLRQQPTIKNVYGMFWKIDLTIWHRVMWPFCLFVEIKTQTIGGSCDSKIPYVVLSLKQQNRPTGLLIVGNGFCPGLLPWLEAQQQEKFLVWRSANKMRDYIETGKFSPSNTIAKKTVNKAQGDLYETI